MYWGNSKLEFQTHLLRTHLLRGYTTTLYPGPMWVSERNLYTKPFSKAVLTNKIASVGQELLQILHWLAQAGLFFPGAVRTALHSLLCFILMHVSLCYLLLILCSAFQLHFCQQIISPGSLYEGSFPVRKEVRSQMELGKEAKWRSTLACCLCRSLLELHLDWLSLQAWVQILLGWLVHFVLL